jgi:hypothetical protein
MMGDALHIQRLVGLDVDRLLFRLDVLMRVVDLLQDDVLQGGVDILA